jgi:hypothetical protein
MTASVSPQWNERWQGALDCLCSRVRGIRHDVGEAWPYPCPAGKHWDTTDDGDWCGGPWVEYLRIVGEIEGDGELLHAQRRTD